MSQDNTIEPCGHADDDMCIDCHRDALMAERSSLKDMEARGKELADVSVKLFKAESEQKIQSLEMLVAEKDEVIERLEAEKSTLVEVAKENHDDWHTMKAQLSEALEALEPFTEDKGCFNSYEKAREVYNKLKGGV